MKAANHGEEHFLRDLFDVLKGEVVAQLINEAACGCVMPVEKLIPGPCLAFETLGQQISFRFSTHYCEFRVGEALWPEVDYPQMGRKGLLPPGERHKSFPLP